MAQLIQIGDMWYSDFRQNGKRIRRALSRYKPEAKNLLKSMIGVRTAQRHGTVVQDMSWPHFRNTYLRASKADKNINTFYADRRGFEVIESVMHLTSIQQMTPERLGNARITLIEKKKFTPCVIAVAIRRMITAMRWAEDNGYIVMQNWRIVQKKNKEPEGRVDFYERDRYLELMAKLEGKFFTGGLVMGRAGLRLGEMVHLQWRDIQWEHRRILFRSKPEFKWYIKGDEKKLRKIRIVPILTNDLWTHLVASRQEPLDFVLGGPKPMNEDVFYRQITSRLKATEIKTYAGEFGHPHLLRHTFGSHLAQVGVPLKKIAEWMGHNSVRMTEGYAHLCPPDALSDAEIGEKLCSGFDPVQGSNTSSKPLLGSLDPQNESSDLSSETDEKS